MIYVIDAIAILLAVICTAIVYFVYYLIFIKGYIRRVKRLIEKNEINKARKMVNTALQKQPKRMKRLFADFDI